MKNIAYQQCIQACKFIFFMLIVALYYINCFSLPQNRAYSKNKKEQNLISTYLNFQQDHTNLCHGSYEEPLITPIKPEQVIVNSSFATIIKDNFSTLKGNVIIQKENQTLKTDLAEIYMDPLTNKIETIKLYNNISIREPGRLLTGKKATLKPTQNTAIIEDSYYYIHLEQKTRIHKNKNILLGNVGWGKSPLIKQITKNKYYLTYATFTTCPPTINNWTISAQKTILDYTVSKGYSYHNILWIKNTPVFYLPYLDFALDNKRKSGFLPPTYSHSQYFGHALEIPYYFNLAPNYDVTFTPQLMTKKRVLLNNEFRYLTPQSNGIMLLSFLPFDKTFDFTKNKNYLFKKHRGKLDLKHNTHLTEQLSFLVDFKYVSDDNYPRDFMNITENIDLQLLQKAETKYTSPNWDIVARIQKNQTLEPEDLLISTGPYQQVPLVGVNYKYHQLLNFLDISLKNEFANFIWDNNISDIYSKNIIRAHQQTSFEIPYKNDQETLFMKPSISLYSTYYDIYKNTLFTHKTAFRFLPSFSLDSNILFSDTITFNADKFTKTIEPRIKYIYIPYTSQSQLPLIDTSYNIVTFSQLFNENRFSGNDRIGDLNQISTGLSIKLSHENQEVFKAGLGQGFYLTDRKVLLYDKTTFNEYRILGYVPTKEHLSPTVAHMSTNLTSHITYDAELGYHIPLRELYNIKSNFQILNKAKHNAINIGYSFTKNGDTLVQTYHPSDDTFNLHRLDTSLLYGITDNWRAIARFLFNIKQNYVISYFAGVEYDSCCWNMRLVGGRFFVAYNKNRAPVFNDAIYVQITLKGLGYYQKNNLDGLLKNSIPGYTNFF